jgi:uncharacterized protein (DUF2384 family)
MAALAPLLDPPRSGDWQSEEVDRETLPELSWSVDPDFVDPASIERQIYDQNLLLARSREIPDSVRYFVGGLADDLATLPVDATLRVDPYLLVSLQSSLIAALRALENPDPAIARRELRVRLEQLRQVYRDLADARPVYEDQPVKQLVRWLAQVLDVPQARLAELFNVSPRTFQRWLSEADESAPTAEDARRVRVVANLVGHLRHALTGRGALDWIDRPHPAIGGRTPRDLLDEPEALTRLTRLAAGTRSMIVA